MGGNHSYYHNRFDLIGNISNSNSSHTNTVSSKVTPTQPPSMSLAEIKSSAINENYDDLMRNNENYIGKIVYYRGKILQVQEVYSGEYVLRVATKKEEYIGYSGDTIWVNYKGKRLLEDDIIDIWGKVKGLKTYSAILGNAITIPEIDSLNIELIQKAGQSTVASTPAPTQMQVVSTSSVTPTPTYTLEPVVVATPTGIITTLKIMNFKFSVLNVQINAGDEVLWNNFDEDYYTIVELDNKIANITLKGTGKASYIFDRSGSYKFGLYYKNKGNSYLCTTLSQCMSTSIQNIAVLP